MDALELLKRDHQNLRELANQTGAAKTRESVLPVFRTLRTELRSHFRVKSLIFYPSFHQEHGFRPAILKSQERQCRIETLAESVGNLLRRPPELTSQIREMITELQNEISAYCDEDESRFFDAARRVMTRSERERLARHLEAERQDVNWVAA